MTPPARLPTMADAPPMFRMVHAALRADAAGIAEEATAPADLEALRRRVAIFTDIIHLHHTAEDELIIPVLLQRRPDACSELLAIESEHIVLDDALARLRVALEVSDAAATGAAARAVLGVLEEHLDHEEAVAVPIWLSVFTEDEMATLETAMKERSAPYAGVLLPWVQQHAVLA